VVQIEPTEGVENDSTAKIHLIREEEVEVGELDRHIGAVLDLHLRSKFDAFVQIRVKERDEAVEAKVVVLARNLPEFDVKIASNVGAAGQPVKRRPAGNPADVAYVGATGAIRVLPGESCRPKSRLPVTGLLVPQPGEAPLL